MMNQSIYRTIFTSLLLGLTLTACGGGGGDSTPTTPPTVSTTFTDNGDGTVSDSATGLMWQQGENATANRSNASTACTNLTAGGYTDWRLPDITDLMSLADYTKTSPSIDINFFPGTALGQYWTTTTPAVSASKGLYVNFYQGWVGYDFTTNFFYSRCVRGTALPTASFTDNGDGTVSDATTGLMWEKCSVGQATTTCAGTATTVGYQQAGTTCSSLSLAGHADWRLPTIKELRFIVDDTAVGPAINTTYFPNTLTNYWSSTVVAGSFSNWYVSFYDGSTSFNSALSANVRCVR